MSKKQIVGNFWCKNDSIIFPSDLNLGGSVIHKHNI